MDRIGDKLNEGVSTTMAAGGGVLGLNTAAILNFYNTEKNIKNNVVSDSLINSLKKHMLKDPDSVEIFQNKPYEDRPSYYADSIHTTEENLKQMKPYLPTNDYKQLVGKKFINFGTDEKILAHELGHASFYEKMPTKLKHFMNLSRAGFGGSKYTMLPAIVGYGYAGNVLADPDKTTNEKLLTSGILGAVTLPTLADEAIATTKGMNALKAVAGISRRESLARLLPAFLTYLSLPAGGVLGGYAYKKWRGLDE
jgi:hypothetical protein